MLSDIVIDNLRVHLFFLSTCTDLAPLTVAVENQMTDLSAETYIASFFIARPPKPLGFGKRVEQVPLNHVNTSERVGFTSLETNRLSQEGYSPCLGNL